MLAELLARTAWKVKVVSSKPSKVEICFQVKVNCRSEQFQNTSMLCPSSMEGMLYIQFVSEHV